MSSAKPNVGGATVTSPDTFSRKSFDKGQENCAAALDGLDGVALTVTKSTSIIKRRLEELDDLTMELEGRLRAMEMENAKVTQDLTTRLEMAEQKLKKVAATIG